MTSREWLLKKLDLTYDDMVSKCRSRELINKRWVMMWFYRAAGKSYNYIANKMGKDHTSVIHCCKHIPQALKAVAEEYLHLYLTEELKKPQQPVQRKFYCVKKPDYKRSKVVYDIVEEKPETVIQKWGTRGWNR